MPQLSRRERLRKLSELPSVTSPAPLVRPDDDLVADLRQPLVSWLDSTCTVSPRCFGGASCLHLSFCEWCIAHGDVPCNRDAFEMMLFELGFLIGEVEGTWLVSGLILTTDLEAHEQFKNGDKS
jgi:hypothetical protein